MSPLISIISVSVNNFFCGVFNKISEQAGQQQLRANEAKHPNARTLSVITFYMQDVYSVLCKLNERKSAGPDNIPNLFLRRCRESLAWPLAILFNKSVSSGCLPQDWRDAVVTPIHKKGSKQACENYRPVSLTSTVVKVMEKIVWKHIVAHVEGNNFLTASQFGFRGSLNCENQLTHYLDTVTKHIDDGNNVDVIYLDMQKAFDKVPHRELSQKLESQFHITGAVGRWINAYLRDRRQRVKINSAFSEWSAVSSGVPQGTILGPIFFLVYVNDLDNVLRHSVIYKFADDTKIVSVVNTYDDAHRLQEDIGAIEAWSAKWKMPYERAIAANPNLPLSWCLSRSRTQL